MPEQPGDITAAERRLLIWDILVELGQATINDILQRLAPKMGIDPKNSNLRRNLDRDLKSFGSKLFGKHFTPSGDPIPIDELDNHKNYRVEYSIWGSEVHVTGGGLVIKEQGHFYPQLDSEGNPTVKWFFHNQPKLCTANHVHLVFKGSVAKYIYMSIHQDELPFKLIISNSLCDTNNFVDLQEDSFRSAHGRRCGRLYWPNKSLSRQTNERLGHCIIQANAEKSKRFTITDCNSTNGTFWAKASSETFNKINTFAEQAMHGTALEKDSPFDQSLDWKKIEDNISIEDASFLKMGKALLFISHNI